MRLVEEMAICFNNLKAEIKTLEKLFSKSHEVFQIVNASVDELTCRFISKSGKKYDIHANITVSPFLIFSHFLSLVVSKKKDGSIVCSLLCVGKNYMRHFLGQLNETLGCLGKYPFSVMKEWKFIDWEVQRIIWPNKLFLLLFGGDIYAHQLPVSTSENCSL